VKLRELQDLCLKILNEAEMQFKKQVKMGIIGIKGYDWNEFSAEDDLSNIEDEYCFISSLKNKDFKGKIPILIERFLDNGITNSFFTKGKNGMNILWRKSGCLEWLKRCKKLLEMLSVLCHLLEGQPARSTEMVTLRWRNSVHEQRGIYWANESMMLLARYSKTRSITGKNRPIPR